MGSRPTRWAVLTAALAVVGPAGAPSAEVPRDGLGRVETLPSPLGPAWSPHWVWVSNPLLQRTSLVDLDEGRFLGQIDGGYGPQTFAFARRRSEVYVPATFYSRRVRGERTDVVGIFDVSTLSPLAEVGIPPKRANDAVALGHVALSDDDRFLAVFNLTPATSLSIVDVERRVFAGEIPTPGCALVYAAGPRRFFSLCGNGALLELELDDRGQEVARRRSEPFFDPIADPVTEKAVRYGDTWLFASFEGRVHGLAITASGLRPEEPWSLFDEAERRAGWRVGGMQHLAVHEPTGRLYSLVHRGGPDTHKQAGEEVWVYDLAERVRVQRIELVSPGLTFLGAPIEVGRDWVWPFSGLWDWVLDHLVPAEIAQIQVTPDDAPLLFTGAQMSGSLGVYDARTGAFLRRVPATGMTTDLLHAPWRGGEVGVGGAGR